MIIYRVNTPKGKGVTMATYKNLIDGVGYYINESKNYPGFYFITGRVSDATFQAMAGFYRKANTLVATDIVNATRLQLEAGRLLKEETNTLKERVMAEQPEFFKKAKIGNCQFKILSEDQRSYLFSLRDGTEYVPKAERGITPPVTTKSKVKARA